METTTQNPNRGKPIWLHILFLTLTPVLVAILVPWWAMTHGITSAEILAMVALWGISGLGITVGYHRLFSHRSFQAPAVIRFLGAILGGAAWQGSVIRWSSGHRHHHNKVDTDNDPYNAKRGFWWSHIGWIFFENDIDHNFDNVPDLKKDPICVWQHRWYMYLSTGFNFGVPALIGWMTGDIWGMLLFGCLVKVVLLHHCTFFINSLAHISGTQPWSIANTSKDNWLLSFFTFGEGYHNYHHAYGADYRNGPKAYNFDPGKWVIWVLHRMGLARQLQRVGHDVIYRRRFTESLERFSPMPSMSQLRERLESSLDELQAARKEMLAAMREFQERRTVAHRKMFKEQKRAFRTARKQAKRTLREWEITLRGVALQTP